METPFCFKKFKIYHQQSTLKVGTDAILLGAWVNTEEAEKILDIGCGCGIITLMLAQKSSALIDGVEIDFKSAKEAKKNANLTEWANRIHIHNFSFQDFIKDKQPTYDLIVCNPPYFNNSLKSNNTKKNLAKHNDSLNFQELCNGISDVLNIYGKACIILPVTESKIFKEIALNHKLYSNSETEVIPRKGLKANRLLMQFEKIKKNIQSNQLWILDENKNYTPEFIELTKDYYLSF